MEETLGGLFIRPALRSGMMLRMVMDPLPVIDELIWIFNSEPQALNEGDDWQKYWPYTAIRFATQSGDDKITLVLEPGSDAVQVHVERNGVLTLDLDLHDVARLDTERLHGKDAVRLAFKSPTALATLHLQLRPTVALVWRVGGWPWEAHPTL